MNTIEEVDKIVLEMSKSKRVDTFHAFIPKPDDNYKFYASISGFLDDDYFDFYIKRPVKKHHTSENGISSLTNQKRKLKVYLKTISKLKFITQN
tara:strand:- start:71 stop:352 length:282 start_codon:yes stop_codon:yes gene_type:complete